MSEVLAHAKIYTEKDYKSLHGCRGKRVLDRESYMRLYYLT